MRQKPDKHLQRQYKGLHKRTRNHDYYRVKKDGSVLVLNQRNRVFRIFFVLFAATVAFYALIISAYLVLFETPYITEVNAHLLQKLPFLKKAVAFFEADGERRVSYCAIALLFVINFFGAFAHTGTKKQTLYGEGTGIKRMLKALHTLFLIVLVVGSFAYEAIKFYDSDFIACFKSVTTGQVLWIKVVVLAVSSYITLSVSDNEFIADRMQAEHEKQILRWMDHVNADIIENFTDVEVYSPAYENYSQMAVINVITLLIAPTPSLKTTALSLAFSLITTFFNVVYHINRQNKILLKTEKGRVRKYQGETFKNSYDQYVQSGAHKDPYAMPYKDPRADRQWNGYWYDYERAMTQEQFRKHIASNEYTANTNLFYEENGRISKRAEDKEYERELKRRSKQRKKYDIW